MRRSTPPARATVCALCLLVAPAGPLAPATGRAAERAGADSPAPPLAPSPPARPPELAATPEPPRGPAPPTPPERPADLRPADLPGSASPDPAKPAPGGAGTPAPAVAEPPLPPGRPPDLSGAAALALKVAPRDDTACQRRLERLGVAFERLPPIAEGQCSAPAPLSVTRLGDGVALEPAATLTCGAAEALARWTTEVQVVAQRELAEPVRALVLGGSYVCRGQNHDLDAKLSEHAFANAVDIAAFAFPRHPSLTVGSSAEGPEGRFLAEVRTGACGFFRTVLGPGSNAAHGTHLHFDERERTAGHRLCE